VDIQHEIASFLTNTLKVAAAPEQLNPDASLVEEYAVDSAGLFEMILWLEDRFSLHVPPEDLDLPNFATIRAAAAYVERARRTAGEVAP